jgi:fumarylacetoacetase
MSNNRIDSNLSSWIFLPKDSDFPIQNIPFGIFQTDTQKARICTRIGDTVMPLQNKVFLVT